MQISVSSKQQIVVWTRSRPRSRSVKAASGQRFEQFQQLETAAKNLERHRGKIKATGDGYRT